MANEDVFKLLRNAYSDPVDIIIDPTGKIRYYSRKGHSDKYLEIEEILNSTLK